MPDVEELKRKSVQGVVSYSLRTALLYLIALGATALLSAYLTPADFGTYFVVAAVIGMFTFLSDVGLAASLIQQKVEPTTTQLRTVFTVQQGLAVMIFLLVLGLTPLWINLTHLTGEGLILLYALAFSFVLASFKTIPSILLERKLQFKRLVIPQIVEQTLFYSLAVILAHKGWGVQSFTLAVLVRSIAGVIAIYLIQSWPIGLTLHIQALKALLGFGVKYQMNDLLARLKDDLYVVVLAKFLPAETMGYIGWAKRWSMFPYQFSVQNVLAITFPTFSRIQEQKKLIQRGLELSVYFIGLIIFPILTGMIFLALPLTILIPAYTKWQPALPSLTLFCLNIALAAVANPFVNALNALKQINTTLKLMITMTTATWVLTPFIYRLIGFNGVALTSVLVAAMGLYGYFVINKQIPVQLVRHLVVQLGASFTMGLLLYGLQPLCSQSWLWMGVAVVGGAVVYGLFMLVFGRKLLAPYLQVVFPHRIWRVLLKDQ